MITILQIDDDFRDFELTSINLKSISGDIQLEWAESAQDALKVLDDKRYDCILSDFQMPQMNGLELLSALRAQKNYTPFIFLTGQGNEKVAAEAFRAGADDYFSKDISFAHYDRIINSIKRVVKAKTDREERFNTLIALRESEEKFSRAFNASSDAIVITNIEDGTAIDVNQGFVEMTGYTREEALGKTSIELKLWKDEEQRNELIEQMNKQGFVRNLELQTIVKTGEEKTVLLSAEFVELGGKKHLLTTTRDISDRKRAEKTLRDKEKLLRDIIDNTPQIVCCKDLDGRCLVVNRAYQEFVHLTEEEMLGKTDYDLFPRDVADQFTANDQKVTSTGIPETYEEYAITEDGTFLYSVTKVPIIDSGGNTTGILGLATDVTEDKAAFEALKKEKAFSERLLEAQRDTVFIFDPATGKPLRWNKIFNKVSGYSDEEIASMKAPEDLFFPEDIEKARKAIKKIQEEGNVIIELPLKTKSGSEVIFEYSATLIMDVDGKPAVISVGRDITDRKKAEKELLEKEIFLRNVIDNTPQLIFFKDPEGKYLLTNRQYQSQSLLQEADMVGKTDHDVFPGEIADQYRAHDKEVLLSGKLKRYEEHAVIGENTYYFDVTKVPVSDLSGNVLGVLGFATDITEKKKAEMALRDSEQKFATAFRSSPQLMGITKVKDGKFVEVNDSFTEISGYSREELLSSSFSDLNFLASPVDQNTLIEKIKESGKIRNFEVTGYKKSGESMELSMSGELIELRGELHLLTVAIDISARKQTEIKLIEKEKFLRDLIDNVPLVIFYKDVNGRYLLTNRQHEKQSSMSEEFMLGKTDHEIFPKEVADQALKNDNEVIASGKPSMYEEYASLKDRDEIFYFEVTKVPVTDTDGNITGTLGLAKDITEQKAAIDAIKEEKAFSERLLEAQRDTVFILDPMTGKPLRWNSIFNKISGYSDEEIASMKAPDDFYYPEDLEKAQEAIKKIQTEGNIVVEIPLKTKSGSRVIFEYSATLTADVDGNPVIISVGRNVTERKRIEKTLRQSRNQFKEFYNSTPAMLHSIDSDGKLMTVSDHWLEMLGYERDEVIGRKSIDFLTPASRKYAVEEALPEFFKRGYANELEYQFVKKNGEIIDVVISAIIRKDSDGKMLHALAVTTEVTERKRAERALRESEERFAMAFHASPQLMAITNLKSEKLVDVNDSFVNTLGYSRDELIGNNPVDLGIWVDPNDREKAKEKLKKDGYFSNTEIEIRKKCGTHFFIRASGRLVQINNEPHLISVGHDITEQLRAVQALRDSEQQFAKAFQSSPLLMAITKLEDGTFVDVNDTYTETTGYSRKELLNNTSVGLNLWVRPEQRQQMVDSIREKGGIRNLEVDVRAKKGTVSTLSMSGELVELKGVPHLISVAEDITDRKAAEQQLRESRNQLKLRTNELEALNKELESFSYSVSHDLRAPLRQIEGFGRVLQDMYADKLDTNGMEYLENVCAASRNMNELILALLEFSRVKRKELEREKTDISSMAHVIVNRLKDVEPERNAKIVIVDNLFAQADTNLVEIVLNNLIGNAWKFTRKEEITKIRVGAKKIRGQKTFYVRDNGVGFNQSYAENLFGPFQRMHDDKEFEGTGIGLATVLRIINRHGGKIWAEAKEGEGATFYFTLG